MAPVKRQRGLLNYLNDSQLKNPKPQNKDHDMTKPFRLNDGGGLFLLCKPTGSRLWRFKYTFNGKRKEGSFGTLVKVNLAQARKMRGEWLEMLGDGIDPLQKKHEVKIAARETFKAVAEKWIKLSSSKWTPRHLGTVTRSLETDAYPTLGNLPVTEITSGMVLKTASAVAEKRGANDVARRVLRRISNVLDYAAVNDLIPVNPALSCMKYMPEVKRSRKPMAAIPWKELPAFIQALNECDMFEQTKLATKLLMLTFVRTGEMRFAKWDEFDLDARVWTVPAERMKMGIEHKVPLSTQAIDVLEQLKAFSGSGDFILAGRSTVMKPISENTILYGIYRMGYKDQMTGHGFRALASSWLNEEGMFTSNGLPRAFNPDAIERQLAHGEPNKIRDAYNRADYMGERETMMQVWADHIDRCADQSGKVVDIKAKRA